MAKTASPAQWRFGLQSWNLAPHVGGTGRLNGSEIAQIDSDGGRLSIVTMSLAVTAWPQTAMQIFGTPFPILGEGEGTEKPKPISQYFEKPIPKPIPTFKKPIPTQL